MSFVRVRRTHSATGIPRKKKPMRRKPVWDDTVNDLTALKATVEEIEYRKASHRSKNALVARLQAQKDLQKKKKKSADLSISNSEARQLAIMKEVLYDQHQFHSTIAKSDKMLSSVKDMFGDDPKRFAGFPRVTAAPDSDSGDRSASLVLDHPDIQTRMEALSQSLMDGSALNDFDSDSDEEAVAPDPITYQPMMNMERFQMYLATEEKNQTLSTISGQAQLSQLAHGPVQSTQIHDTASLHTSIGTGCETPKRNPNESISILKTPRSAINDTKKVKKTRKRVAPAKSPPHNNTSAFNLTDLRKVLENLQEEIAEFERQTGRRAPAEKHRQETFSGYTLSLIDSVTKLSRYLKENDIRLRAETTLREQLTQDISQLAALIDALTSDIILTQEESAMLKSEFTKYRVETQSEIYYLKSVLQKAGLIEGEGVVIQTPPRAPPPSHAPADMDERDDAKQPQELSAIPDHVQSASAAVLLSPPVRKSHQMEEEVLDTRMQTAPHTTGADLPSYSSGFLIGGAKYMHGPISSNPSVASSVDSRQERSLTSPGLHPSSGVSVTAPAVSYGIPPQGSGGPSHTDSVSLHNSQGPSWYPQSQFLQSMESQSSRQQQSLPVSTTQGYSQVHPSASYPGQGIHGIQTRPYLTNNAARVAVPRPSPLVQSNVGVSLQSSVNPALRPGMSQMLGGRVQPTAHQGMYPLMSQSGGMGGQDPALLAHTSGLSAPPSYNSKDILAAQILELNKQHEEAQVRLQVLMQQQQHQHLEHLDQHHTLQETNSELQAATTLAQRRPQQHGLPSYPVSPPISPISQKSDKFLSLQGLAIQNNAGSSSSREITVSLPSMSLDSTNESSPSPKRA